ncbi:MAG: radical SAM protein [Nitrososphaerota archaeon]|nr:radical SAM protein [Candidatus Nezhaarchaeota archaeon]MDW8049852.1 radical SAM protein [Nitrososphaerota archaeon]
MKATKYLSYYVGELPKGCSLCMNGMKVTYFATGLCTRSCFYCPLSRERRGKDVTYADEVPVRDIEDVINEARLVNAKGIGVTGGDPLLRVKRVVETIKVLRDEFSNKLHVHLYTTTQPHVNYTTLKKLVEARVDELRFHPNLEQDDPLNPVKLAVEMGFNTGIEIPSLPGYEDRIVKILDRARRLDVAFVVINELEMTEYNAVMLQIKGYRLKAGSPSAVEGSWEVAMSLLRVVEDMGLSGHFCPAYIKDSAQFRNRLKRKAKNLVMPHETITPDPLLVKGMIKPPEGMGIEEAFKIVKQLMPTEYIHLNIEKKRIECNYRKLKAKAKILKEIGFSLSIVGEMPTSFREQVFLKPI